jgi:hypothetical protein
MPILRAEGEDDRKHGDCGSSACQPTRRLFLASAASLVGLVQPLPNLRGRVAGQLPKVNSLTKYLRSTASAWPRIVKIRESATPKMAAISESCIFSQ